MKTKILAAVYVVLAAVLLLASAPLARADEQPGIRPEGQAERDFSECLQPGGLVPPGDDLKICMLQKGYSDEETTDIIRSLPDQPSFAPDTGDLGSSGSQGESGGI